MDETIGDLELDLNQFKNCLISLLENAFYRMSQTGEIYVNTKRVGEHATVTLSYKVPYITDDDINDFFYPFTVSYPFGDSDTSNEEIMDIPICKRIVHNHCGMITVSRENENHLWIDISLPLER